MSENTTKTSPMTWAEIRLQDAEADYRRAQEALDTLHADPAAPAEAIYDAEAGLEDAALDVEGATWAYERSKETGA